MPTAIYKYIFQPFTVCFMILINKNTFFLLSPDYVSSHLYKYITEPPLYPYCTRPTCLLLVLTVIKNFLTITGEQYACLPYIHKTHGRLRNNHGRLLLVSFTEDTCMSTKHLHIISKRLLHVQKRLVCAYSYIQVYTYTIHCMCYDFEK